MPDSDQKNSTPIALTIAGSDSGGGAGIQADLKTFSALGVYGASVITAITAQNTRTVSAIQNVSAELISAQIDTVFDDLKVSAVKIGMLSSPEIIELVAAGLASISVPLVLDPVMVAKSGDKLLQQNAIESLKNVLIPRASLITPNLPEAATLLDCADAGNEAAMRQQCEALLELGAKAVLMKGGHSSGSECVDLLVTREGVTRFSAERIQTNNTHGTGCTLSSAIAAHLALGYSMVDAVRRSHAYLHEAIRKADTLHIGSGHGPVHHFHEAW